MTERDDTVWYVAYGSNLSMARLQRYLDALPGKHPALEDRPATLPHRLFFARETQVWGGGGCAFVDPEPSDTVTLARAWRMTRAQFVGVLTQENGGRELVVDDAVLGLGSGESAVVGPGWYGLVLGCPSPDHRPALTFTTPDTPLPVRNPPGEAYVATIVAGLVDTHGLTEDQARAYVAARIR